MYPSAQLLLQLLAVVAFHELGHLLFRPWKGSAWRTVRFRPASIGGFASGPPACREALGALMGPLPGVALACVLMAAGLHGRPESWMQAAYVLVLFNGLNLLPFYPLDGGRFLAALGFIKTPAAETVFRGFAGLGLGALAIGTGQRWLIVFAFIPLFGLREAVGASRLACRLKAEGWSRRPEDAGALSEETRAAIRTALAPAQPDLTRPRALDRLTRAVVARLNHQPASPLATIGLCLLYCAGVVGAVVAARFPELLP